MRFLTVGIIVATTCLGAACEQPPNPPVKAQAQPTVASLAGDVPMPSEAADMLGKRLDLDGLAWLNTSQKKPAKLGKVTLVRWWTDTCPACAMSLPAIEQQRKQFTTRGLQTIAVYHPKPPRDVAPDVVLKRAAEIGYTGPIATDLKWKKLRSTYLDNHTRHSTSVSFLLDQQGVIRYVHPGPAFGPTKNPDLQQLNQDYLNLTAAIEALLAQNDAQPAQTD